MLNVTMWVKNKTENRKKKKRENSFKMRESKSTNLWLHQRDRNKICMQCVGVNVYTRPHTCTDCHVPQCQQLLRNVSHQTNQCQTSVNILNACALMRSLYYSNINRNIKCVCINGDFLLFIYVTIHRTWTKIETNKIWSYFHIKL